MSSRTGPAWPPLSADPNTIMAWCLAYERPTPFYTQRLGLHHKEALPSTERKNKGKPMFEGEVASECNRLHKMIREAVQRIADIYHTKEELETAVKLQHDLSIVETTRPLLAHIGPIIWNDSEPYQTKILSGQYPRHLKFQNENDLQTIMLYVYCWIIGRVARAHANRRASRSRRAHRDISMSSSEDKNLDDIDDSGHSEEYVAGVFGNGQLGTNRYGRRINNTSVPVASMLPMASNKTTSATHPGVTQPSTEGSSQTVACRDRSNALVDSGDESGTFQPDSPTNPRGIKRKGYSTINAPLNKRVAKAKHGSPTPALLTRGKARGIGTDEEADTASYPSPPLLQLDELDEAPNGRNFPNVQPGSSRDWNKVTVTRDTSVPNKGNMAPNQQSESCSLFSAKEHGSITVTVPTDPTSDNGDEDNDSVQGLEVSGAETIHVCRKTTPSIARRHLVVRLKLTILPDDNKYDRQCLASELYDVLFGKLQKLDIVVVESTLDLLESVYKAIRLRPANVSVANLGRYRDSFDQWLRCFRLVVQYYKDTKFTGNLSELRAFKKTMPGGHAKSMTQILLRGRTALLKWQRESKINNNNLAKQVALVLFQVASWPVHVDLQEVEEITLEFTEELLAWF